MSRVAVWALLLTSPWGGLAGAQTSGGEPARAAVNEPVAVFTEHPRLFLRPAHLRMLRRERERDSPRWQQLAAWVSQNAPMPESAFAQALYYQVAGDNAAGRRAVAWALGPGSDLRQLALVFDWCQDLLHENERRSLIARLQQRLAETAADDSIAAVRSRTLAAVALYDDLPDMPNRELDHVVHVWWEGKIAPALNAGRDVVARDDAYPLWELLHAIRDNTNLDLRESARAFFQEFPIEHLLSYYPAAFRGPDNDYRIGATTDSGEPNLRQAALSRAAEFCMVAYDDNAEESQYLQGWLTHDRYMLRDAFGAPYEFLWANPYQPGLSFMRVPLIDHNATFGRLFVRSSWDDDAAWFGYFDGAAQLVRDGQRLPVDLQAAAAPLSMASAVIAWGAAARRLRVHPGEGQDTLILLGLAPSRTYQVQIGDEKKVKTSKEVTDPGGILVLHLQPGKEVGVRVAAAPRAQ